MGALFLLEVYMSDKNNEIEDMYKKICALISCIKDFNDIYLEDEMENNKKIANLYYILDSNENNEKRNALVNEALKTIDTLLSKLIGTTCDQKMLNTIFHYKSELILYPELISKYAHSGYFNGEY